MSSPRALIADDEQTMRSLLSDLLRQEGCAIIAKATNGVEAYKLFKSKKPDLVFLDINMPEENGIEALKKIRADDPDIFVCMVSADAYPETVKAAVAEGVSGFIVKPLSQTRVHEVVANYRMNARKE